MDTVTQIADERRASRRYAIRAGLEFSAFLLKRSMVKGKGTIVNMSRSGVLIQSTKPLHPGMEIELRIAWPARMENEAPVDLHVRGRTVRTDGVTTAIIIGKGDFRVRGAKTPLAQRSVPR